MTTFSRFVNKSNVIIVIPVRGYSIGTTSENFIVLFLFMKSPPFGCYNNTLSRSVRTILTFRSFAPDTLFVMTLYHIHFIILIFNFSLMKQFDHFIFCFCHYIFTSFSCFICNVLCINNFIFFSFLIKFRCKCVYFTRGIFG